MLELFCELKQSSISSYLDHGNAATAFQVSAMCLVPQKASRLGPPPIHSSTPNFRPREEESEASTDYQCEAFKRCPGLWT